MGVLLGLAFVQPRGERLPAWTVLLPVWVGTGLLVPMLFLIPVLGPAAVAVDRQAGATATWAVEQVFVIVSLVGIGLGLPAAFAGYAKTRWPQALGGPIGHGEAPRNTRPLQITLARFVAVWCVALGAIKVFWALGGTTGIDPTRLDARDLWWTLLTLSTGVWSLLGAWAILSLAARRGFRRFLPPMMIAWVSSGMLFSYNLFAAMRADSQASPEHPLARVLTTQTAIVAGLLMAVTVLLIVHDRREASRASG